VRAGEANGVETIWVNGKQAMSRSDVNWRADGKFTIEKFTFRSFHGGTDPADFAPDHDQYLWCACRAVATGAVFAVCIALNDMRHRGH
jgi:hypothetical protein